MVEVEASHTKVTIGTSVTLHCNVIRTNPEVVVYAWIHENPSIVLTNGTDNVSITVVFSTEQHFGIIYCIATNAAASEGNASVIIEQGCKLLHKLMPIDLNCHITIFKFADPPTVTVSRSSATPPPVANYSSFVQLICVVTGLDPPEQISWTLNDMEIYFTNTTHGENNTVIISSSDYGLGLYICMASNEYGRDTSRIYVLGSGLIFS